MTRKCAITQRWPGNIIRLTLLAVLTFGFTISQASAKEPFYWPDSHGDVPPGYIHCGVGFAVNKVTCAGVIFSQVSSAAGLVSGAITGKIKDLIEAQKAGLSPADVEEGEEVTVTLAEFLQEDIGPGIKEMVNDPAEAPTIFQRVVNKASSFFEDHPKLISRLSNLSKVIGPLKKGMQVAVVTKEALETPDGILDGVRLGANVAALFSVSPVPIFPVIAAYAYPVYRPGGTHSNFANNRHLIDWHHWTYIYTVDHSGQLRYYRMDGAGGFTKTAVIGSGWNNMRFITAGSDGDLFALSKNGTLYFYQNNIPQMTWRVEGEALGRDFANNLIAMFSGGGINVDSPHGARFLFIIKKTANGEDPLYELVFSGGSHPHEIGAPKQIGWYWGKNNVRLAFGGWEGVIYKVTPNQVGTLDRYDFTSRSTPKPLAVGWEFNAFKQLFAGPFGAVFGITHDGDLLFYQDPNNGRMLHGPVKIGNGWNFRLVTAAKEYPHFSMKFGAETGLPGEQ